MGNYGLAHDNLPSLNTSLTYKFPGGHDVLTAAMLRKLSVEKAKEAASDESEPGWAVRGAANIKPRDIVTLKTLAIHGDGTGNDLAGTGARLLMSWKQGKKARQNRAVMSPSQAKSTSSPLSGWLPVSFSTCPTPPL